MGYPPRNAGDCGQKGPVHAIFPKTGGVLFQLALFLDIRAQMHDRAQSRRRDVIALAGPQRKGARVGGRYAISSSR
jgi:hypothetical protein